MYITKDELKKYLGANFDAGMDSFVDTVIAGCQSYIEKFCGNELYGKRVFEAPAGDAESVRKFDGTGAKRLFVGDIFDFSSVEVDGIEYVEESDFFAYPLNNDAEAFHYLEMAQPATRINSNSRLMGESPYIFEKAQANILITGKWYFSTTAPAEIKLATLKLAGAVLKENINDEDIKEKKQQSLGDYSVQFQDIDKLAHSLKVSDLLSPYTYASTMKASGVNSSVATRTVS